jgi:hypothetical protein
MRTLWEKLVQFVGTNYGQDISNELQNKIPVILSEPVHMPEVLARHAIQEQMVRTGKENLQGARNALLMKHRGQTFSPILGQCTQLLQDRMKQDTDWNAASTSYSLLDLY